MLLVQSLRDGAPDVHIHEVPLGGLCLWAQLPDRTDTQNLVRESESRGLIIDPGTEWFQPNPGGLHPAQLLR